MLNAFKKSLSWFGKSKQFFAFFAKSKNYPLLWIKLFFLVLFLLIGWHSYQAYQVYQTSNTTQTALPIVGKVIGSGLAFMALFVSLFLSKKRKLSTRQRLVVISLWLVAIGGILTTLPADYINTQAAIGGLAEAGETHSIPVHIGKLVLIAFLILSIPFMAQLYFRMGLMDKYVVSSFLEPFFFNIVAILSIWLIIDFDDNGGDFGGLYDRMGQFYAVQIPFMILFVMPICILLSLLLITEKEECK